MDTDKRLHELTESLRAKIQEHEKIIHDGLIWEDFLRVGREILEITREMGRLQKLKDDAPKTDGPA